MTPLLEAKCRLYALLIGLPNPIPSEVDIMFALSTDPQVQAYLAQCIAKDLK